MARDTAVQAASQSQRIRHSTPNWYSFIRSAIVAGFEAYGSAQIGMCPAKLPGIHSPAEFEGVVPAGPATCNLPVASIPAVPAFNVRSCPSEGVVNTVWKLA